MDLLAFDLDEGKCVPELDGHSESVPWTVDSGASEAVANPKHFPDCAVEASQGSLAGQTYIGPGAENNIPNLGKLTAKRMMWVCGCGSGCGSGRARALCVALGGR